MAGHRPRLLWLIALIVILQAKREHSPNRVSSEQVPGNQSPDLPMPGASGSTFEPLLTLVEAASLLKIHPKTLEK
jgi:hypothetical protein